MVQIYVYTNVRYDNNSRQQCVGCNIHCFITVNNATTKLHLLTWLGTLYIVGWAPKLYRRDIPLTYLIDSSSSSNFRVTVVLVPGGVTLAGATTKRTPREIVPTAYLLALPPLPTSAASKILGR